MTEHCEKCNYPLIHGWARSGDSYTCLACGYPSRLMEYQEDGILCGALITIAGIRIAQAKRTGIALNPALNLTVMEVIDKWNRIQEQNDRFWRVYAETHAQHVEEGVRGKTDPIDSPIGPITLSTLSTGRRAGRRWFDIQAPAEEGSGWTRKSLSFVAEDRIDTHQGNFGSLACSFNDAMIMIETAISALEKGVAFKEEESA